MQIFSESLRRVWSGLEIRILVLVSLTLQGILIFIGNRRKFSSRNGLRFILWLTYLSADWVATVSLSVISIRHLQPGKDEATNQMFIITAFWAPFLLQHLGGPDTITAYSVEDNELWWRHALTLIVQISVAIYIGLKAWNGNLLNYLSIPMFISGIYRFMERTWTLRSASSKNFRKSMFPRPDPGPNYARYMEEYCTRRDEGFRVSSGRIFEGPTIDAAAHGDSDNNVSILDTENLKDAFSFFNTFKRLFADLILSIHDIAKSRAFFQREANRDKVFKVIEIELGYLYDVLYTKADVNFSVVGVISRLVSLLLVIFVSVYFFVIGKQDYSGADVIITYILLAGACFLELCSIGLLASSDWTMLWLSMRKGIVVDLLSQALSKIFPPKKQRWCNEMAQYNLIRYSLTEKPAKCSFLQKCLSIDDVMERYRYRCFKRVPEELKNLIFKQLLNKSMSDPDFSVCKKLCIYRGQWVLERARTIGKLGWSIEDVEFDQSILLWHIATDLCYYSEINGVIQDLSPKENSKLLSQYMLYLLVMRPFMLPNGIGQIRYQDTCAEAMEFFEERKSITSVERACELLLQVSTEIPPSEVKGDRSKSVLFDACRLAKALQQLETGPNWGRENMWELISHVWVEMLSYAASQCQITQHIQQLPRGGELLTHVWLLMAHLGITEQFQISKGHARAKLIIQ